MRLGAHRNVALLASNVLVQACGAEQLDDLALLVGLHAREGHAVLHHRLHQGCIGLVQQALKRRPRHAALHVALHTSTTLSLSGTLELHASVSNKTFSFCCELFVSVCVFMGFVFGGWTL